MSQSEQINELVSALAKAQGEMQAAIKDKVNPFYKSSYADLSSVWDVARPVLGKNGLCIMQTTELVNNQIIMVTTLAHTSGQWVKSYLPLILKKDDSQGIGAAMTCLRRYALCAIVCIVCEEDDDGETAVGRGKAKNNPPPAPKQETPTPPLEKINGAEIVSITSLLNQLDEESKHGFFGWVKKCFNVDALTDLPRAGYEKCMNSLIAKIKFLKSQERETA